MTRLCIVRHGRSAFNIQNHAEKDNPVLGGQTNTQLAPEGEAAADQLGLHFAERGIIFDTAISSALDRSKNTLHRILRQQPATVRVLDPLADLNERGLGAFEGMRLSDVHARFPEYHEDPHRQFRASYDVRAPGGEHYGDVEKRMGEAIQSILQLGGANILVVTHKHSIRAWIRQVLDLPRETALKMEVPNTTPIIMEYDGSYRLIEGLTP